MPRCCMQGGYRSADHVTLLAALAEMWPGLAMFDPSVPSLENAQVWGPRDGRVWVLVDAHGTELGVYGRHSVGATAKATKVVLRKRADGIEVAPG